MGTLFFFHAILLQLQVNFEIYKYCLSPRLIYKVSLSITITLYQIIYSIHERVLFMNSNELV